jgi:hypothetical protein
VQRFQNEEINILSLAVRFMPYPQHEEYVFRLRDCRLANQREALVLHLGFRVLSCARGNFYIVAGTSEALAPKYPSGDKGYQRL